MIDDPNLTVMEVMGRRFSWNGDKHRLVVEDVNTGAIVILDGLQTAALRAFVKGTDPTTSLIGGNNERG